MVNEFFDKTGRKFFACTVCTYSGYHHGTTVRHVKSVHFKIQRGSCGNRWCLESFKKKMSWCPFKKIILKVFFAKIFINKTWLFSEFDIALWFTKKKNFTWILGPPIKFVKSPKLILPIHTMFFSFCLGKSFKNKQSLNAHKMSSHQSS